VFTEEYPMSILSLRALRGAACLAVALSAFAAVQAKTPVKPTAVPMRHDTPVTAELPSAARAKAMPARARAAAMPARERSEAIDSDGSRFQYDSCGCGS
jgi:hypothetical protein